MNIEQIAYEEASGEMLDYFSKEQLAGYIERCLSKLAEQSGVEPVAHCWHEKDGSFAMGLLGDAEALPIGVEIKLYIETQLLAVQQRTAEACAEACEDEIGNTPNDQRMIAAIDCAAMIRNGEWREYL